MAIQTDKNITLEEQIVTFLQQKDKKAISLLYKNYSGALFGIIKRTIPSEEVANEVLQDVFVKVWKNADKYNAQKGRLFTWLVQITRNASIDTIRSGRYQRGTKTDELDVIVSNSLDHSEEADIKDEGLRNVVNELDPKYRSIIDLVYFQSYTQSEVAKELDIPIGTVKTRVRSAILELRKKLGKEFSSAMVLVSFLENYINS